MDAPSGRKEFLMDRLTGLIYPIWQLPAEPGERFPETSAKRFADFLSKSGQFLWNLLPSVEQDDACGDFYAMEQLLSLPRDDAFRLGFLSVKAHCAALRIKTICTVNASFLLHAGTDFAVWMTSLGDLFDCVILKGFDQWDVDMAGADPAAISKCFRESAKETGTVFFTDADFDLLTPASRKFIQDSGILQQRFLTDGLESRDATSVQLPHHYVPASMACLRRDGSMPAGKWVYMADPDAVAFAVDYLNLSEREGYAWGLLRGVLSSVAQVSMVHLVDFYGGQPIDFDRLFSDEAFSFRLRYMAGLYGRLPATYHGRKKKKESR